MKYSQRWRQTTLANRMLVISSGLMTVATIFLTATAIYQYRTMKEQAAITRDQLRTMEDQTNTMRDQAEAAHRSANIAADQSQAVKDSAQAAKDSAEAARNVVGQNERLIIASEKQTSASQTSVEIARQTLLPEIAFSAHLLALPTVGQQIDFQLTIMNAGGSQAIVTTNIRAYGLNQVPDDCSGGEEFGPVAVLPNKEGFARAKFNATDAQIRAIQEEKLFFFVCGKGTQKGFGGTVPLDFCYVWNKGFNMMGQCSDFYFIKKEK